MLIFKHIFFNKKILILNQNILKISFRKVSHEYVTSGTSKPRGDVINTHYNHYLNLPLPHNKIFATYVWVDGSGINLRSKDRILSEEPQSVEKLPQWSFDGSSTGQAETHDSDITLVPCAIYRDPFRKCPNIIVLCETYSANRSPTSTNHRAHCAKVMSDMADLDPWFGIEQEFTIFDSDLWPLGWPKLHGFPTTNPKFSYCGVGEHISGRDIAESHARACAYSGMDYGGLNAEVMKGSWEFQVGPTLGVKAADDLWVGRYFLSRIAEQFGAIISFHPKPMGKDQPGIGCHHNFSTNKMRGEEGIIEIERVCKILCDKNNTLMKGYGLGDGEDNKKRLTGKFETPSFESCKWGVADRSASVRLQRSIVNERKGFLEDRRPAGNCDPYKVCTLLAETCLIK